MTKINRTYITLVLILGSLEFFTAAGFTFSINPDPKNAMLFGFSAARWAIAFITIGLGITCLYFANHVYSKGVPDWLNAISTKDMTGVTTGIMSFFLVSLIIIILPPELLGRYAAHFRRIQPLLIVTTILPIQMFTPMIFKSRSQLELSHFKYIRFPLLFLILLVSTVIITRWGIEPDTQYWNEVGVPITTLQLLVAFLITILTVHIVNKLLIPAKVSPIFGDVFITFLLYIAAIGIWSQTHMVKHPNALRPTPPVFQYFPALDASVHDLGAISIIDGYGINFGQYTDKPLYMVFLSILHRVAGNDYNHLSSLHMYIMALVIPCLFWMGKNIQGRYLGIAIAIVTLIRQRNAILLAHQLAGTNPRLFLTEIPTMLGLIFLSIVMFFWFQNIKSEKPAWGYPLLAGGVIGATSLLRLNPLGLIPVIILLGLFAFPRKRLWFKHNIIFLMGVIILIAPWAITGQDVNGQPYLLVKFLDVINVRYSPISPSSDASSIPARHTSEVVKIASSNTQYVNPDPLGDIFTFPGFVINHTFHNFVTSFLTLPDSLAPNYQMAKNMLQRPYLDKTQTWHGELQVSQIPFILINLIFISVGIGWSWQRWKWAGIFPAILFFSYSFLLGFGRTSGARYIVPVDWIVYLYYIGGIILVLFFFTNLGKLQIESPPSFGANYLQTVTFTVLAVALIVTVSTLILKAQKPIITGKFPSCKNQIIDPNTPKSILIIGRSLYPRLEDKKFSFVFLTCNQHINFSIESAKPLPLKNEQIILIRHSDMETGLIEEIFIEQHSGVQPIWER